MKNSWLTGFHQALGKIVSEEGNVGNPPSSLSYSSGLHHHLNFFIGFICLKNIFVAFPNPQNSAWDRVSATYVFAIPTEPSFTL